MLAKNDLLAEQNRQWLAERGILALNVTSSPGAGKTTLLERTIRELDGRPPGRRHRGRPGDAARRRADPRRRAPARCRSTPAPAATSTPTWCTAHCTHSNPEPESLLFIENVGNLVCPALFDLGEHSKVVVISVTEGEDKPLKYPHMFAAAGLVLINKIDLLPYVDFDLETCLRLRPIGQPRRQDLAVSATTGDGCAAWYDWIDSHARSAFWQTLTCPYDPLTRHSLGSKPRTSARESGRKHDPRAIGTASPAPESCDACQLKQQSKRKRR